MRIQQNENGNIIIQNDSGLITHILSSMSVQKHPRKDNALLIFSADLEQGQGIEFLADKRIYINGKSYNLDANSLLDTLHINIVLGGTKTPPTDSKPKTKEEDPKYVEFLQSNTYEKLLVFAKKYNKNIGGKNYQNGKLIEEEFYCQFYTFAIKVGLRYKYQLANPNLIQHIQMWGSTQYVAKPKKVFVYDENNTITGYVYKETFED